MKNQLKIAFGVVLISLFSIECKKDSTTPVKGQKVRPPKFTVSSDTFKDGGVDHDLLKKNKINGPHVAWENPPVGTKGYWIIMDDDKKYVYYSGQALANFSSLREDTFGPFSSPNFTCTDKSDATTAAIEIFALNCTPLEFSTTVEKGINGERIAKASRTRFKKIVKKEGLSNVILGSAVAKYKIKPQASVLSN